MSHARDVDGRRRRVLYSAHQAEQGLAASHHNSERLREARRPAAAYGARVERRLQGRWFSLVPIRRRTMILIAGLITALTFSLCGAHYASVAWPSLSYQPEIARPLRLDRPDSFGRWFVGALLFASAATSLLIYQLRRYRLDDYHGRYRLWRLVLLIFLLASVNAVVGLIDWGGALLDAGFGKRVALSGSDWIRLVLSFAGAVFGIRLAAEVRRSRLALIAMLGAFGLLAIPEAANWNVLKVESLGSWVLVTSAPLMACTALLIALVGYLRLLYREVLQIEEPDSVREAFQQLCRQLSMRLDYIATSNNEDDEDKEARPRGWLRRRKADKSKRDARGDKRAKATRKPSSDSRTEKRGWFRSRSDKKDKQTSEGTAGKQPTAERKKSSRFSMRLAPPTTNQNSAQAAQPASPGDDQDTKSKSGIGGWLRREKSAKSETEQPASAKARSSSKPTTNTSAEKRAAEASDNADSSGIDWSSMSKSERRRLRKQLKRRNRAA